MESILIVSSSKKGRDVFKDLLSVNLYKDIAVANNSCEARRIFIDKEFDLCIINTPLTDEFGTDLALNLSQTGISQVLLIVNFQHIDEIAAKVEESGVFVIPKPINQQLFWGALKIFTANHNRIKGLHSENLKLQKTIEDIKTIDRAKCLLVQHLKITESEAHKFIEKQAMNLRITRKRIAERILETYDS